MPFYQHVQEGERVIGFLFVGEAQEGRRKLRWVRKVLETSSLLNTAKVSSILLENGYPKHVINSAFKRKLQQLNSNPVHTVEKCPVYLYIPLIGNVSMKFEKQITSAVKRCFFSVELRVIFNTRQLLPATKKDVLPSHHRINVIYQFVCHCDSRYIGRTSKRLEERIKQHVPRSIANPPASHNRQSLSALARPTYAHNNFTNLPLFNNLTTPNTPFTKTTKNFLFSLEVALLFTSLEVTFIKSLNPLLCKQKEFVYSLKIS